MYHYIFRFFTISFVLTSFAQSVFAVTPEQAMSQAVLKLQVYERNTISGNYELAGWGSAVILDSKRVITNAHVILDSKNEKPTGYYELCRNVAGKKYPVCFTTAKLISYDTVADIALLEPTGPLSGARSMTLSNQNLSIGSSMIVYGYPYIGGSNITRTEGKVGGTEGDKYKFDGSIDHGNSGGGAFDTAGNLIGIPYAVSSDNGVIGYVIPVKLIQAFLSKKSYNLETYTSPPLVEFTKYRMSMQALSRSTTNLKTPYVEVKGLSKLGLTLSVAASSLDGKVFDYRFMDKNERVSLALMCSKDASLRAPLEFSLAQLDNPSNENTRVKVMTGYYDDKKTLYYFTYSVSNTEKKTETSLLTIMHPESAPTCMTVVVATDGTGKDKALYEKTIALAKTVRYTNPSKVAPVFESTYFTVPATNTAYIYEGTTIIDKTIAPHIMIELSKGLSTESEFFLYRYDEIDDYMNMYHSDDSPYRGKTYTFDDFYNRYHFAGDQEVIIKSKNGKKMIFGLYDASDDTIESGKTRVVIYYPFRDQAGSYRAYRVSFEYNSRDTGLAMHIRTLFESMALPGTSPFTD